MQKEEQKKKRKKETILRASYEFLQILSRFLFYLFRETIKKKEK